MWTDTEKYEITFIQVFIQQIFAEHLNVCIRPCVKCCASMTFLLIFQWEWRDHASRNKGHILAIWLWMSHLTSRRLSFLPCEMRGLATSGFQSFFFFLVAVRLFSVLTKCKHNPKRGWGWGRREPEYASCSMSFLIPPQFISQSPLCRSSELQENGFLKQLIFLILHFPSSCEVLW